MGTVKIYGGIIDTVGYVNDTLDTTGVDIPANKNSILFYKYNCDIAVYHRIAKFCQPENGLPVISKESTPIFSEPLRKMFITEGPTRAIVP